MHHLKKKRFAALKEQGTTAEELKALILQDGNTEEEANALITELYTEAGTGTKPPEKPKETHKVTKPTEEQPGEKTGKGKFEYDFKNLTGENFKKYEEHVNSLPLFDLQDFKVYKVNPVIVEQYPGLPNSPKIFNGIEIVNDKPIHQTRIDMKTAKEMNAQARNTGRYYLLA